MQYRQIDEIQKLEGNPRIIRDDQFQTLCESIKDNPDYFEARPIILSNRTGQLVIIAGNQRYEAARHIGMERVPTVLIEGLTESREKEIVIRDNISNGEFDYDILANSWSELPLNKWGMTLPEEWLSYETPEGTEPGDENYTRKIEPPIYEPSEVCPPIEKLLNDDKTQALKAEIEGADIPEDVKTFLFAAAERHTIFNFNKIADYYSHAPAEIQRLMEDSALVLIDFDKAIENGFVKYSKSMAKLIGRDYPDA